MTAYFHLMRALGATVAAGETFAFATRLTRLTPVLRGTSRRSSPWRWRPSGSPTRFGGTHLAALRCASCSPRGTAATLRGGVLVIASDGWDSDPPDGAAPP